MCGTRLARGDPLTLAVMVMVAADAAGRTVDDVGRLDVPTLVT